MVPRPLEASQHLNDGNYGRSMRNLLMRLSPHGVAKFVLGALTGLVLLRMMSNAWSDDLGFDEALIGQVADSLVGRREYAFYGGASGTGPVPFSPGISTGAPVILPAAVLWFVTQGSLWTLRVIAMAGIAALLIGWWRLLSRGPLRPALFGALVAGFALAGDRLSIGHMLGEIPATAMIVWSIGLRRDQRTKPAALLLGLAVLTKVAMLPVVGLLGLAYMVTPERAESFRSRLRDKRAMLSVPAVALLPVVVFEFWKFIALGGFGGYRGWLDEFRSFVASQNINTYSSWRAGGLLDAKIDSLQSLLTVALLVSFGLFMLVRLVESAQGSNQRAAPRDGEQDSGGGDGPAAHHLVILTAVACGSVIMIATWVLQSKLADPRQPLPGVLLLLTVLAVLLNREPRVSGGADARSSVLPLFAALPVLTSALLGAWPNDLSMLSDDQRLVIDLAEGGDVTSIFADGFFENPEIQLATGLPAVPWLVPERQLVVIGSAQMSFLYGSWSAAESRYCSDAVTQLGSLLVCEARSIDYSPLDDLTVVDWGEKDAVLGVVSNRGIYGYGGIWTILEPEDPLALRAIRMYIDGEPIELGDIESDGRVMTWRVPPSVYRTPGRHVIEYRNMITGQVIPVGEFTL